LKKIAVFFLALSISVLSFAQNSIPDSVVNSYFDEIARYDEYTNLLKPISKFTTPINAYINQTYTVKKEHLKKVKKVFKELNKLCPSLTINYVDSQVKSNFIIIFGEFDYLYEIYPKSMKFGANYDAGGIIEYGKAENNISSIIKTVVIFDFNKINSDYVIDDYFHFIREELTQGLGLINDSWKYPESIFYQGDSKTIEYTELDKAIIQKLYN
jgi:hypothetical protein